MKILFAVNSEKISESISKKYREQYKEIISSKNVYYFNAVLKEIQKDKSYDRIVISEDLEPFSNNNYDQIDKTIFDKLDNISDEAQDLDGNETSIILICSDRHTKGCSFLVKIFGIGIYSALLGADRSIEQVCKLIDKPRSKKEAKQYYKIDSDDVNYSKESDKEVSELEIQNILNHFKKLGKNTSKYAESFNNIALQYTDEQLRIIINCLPINVKAVLEEDSLKYQEIMSVNGVMRKVNKENLKVNEIKKRTGLKIDIIENKINENKVSGPIVIPSSVKTSKNKNLSSAKPVTNNVEISSSTNPKPKIKKIVKEMEPMEKSNMSKKQKNVSRSREEEERLRRKMQQTKNGMPVKKKRPVVESDRVASTKEVPVKKKKVSTETASSNPVKVKTKLVRMKDGTIKRVRVKDDSVVSREKTQIKKKSKNPEINKKKVKPRKTLEPDEDLLLNNYEDDEYDDMALPGLDDDLENNDLEDDDVLPGIDDNDLEDDLLPSLDDEEPLPSIDDETEDEFTDEVELPGLDELDEIDEESSVIPSFDDSEDEEDDGLLSNNFTSNQSSQIEESNNNELESIKPRVDYSMSSLNSLLTKDKKIVTFLGTTKNGTSFLVNNLAALFSSLGINTAILDMTKNRNSYYIYTNNEEELRNIAYNSISKLQKGFAEGIKVNKNLTVYTALPNDGKNYIDSEPILSTLVQNHSLILVDCDFDTDPSYFASCQEIYLVQSMDILTIQPLTAFLRDLKSKGVLESEKVRVVINKEIKVRNLTAKAIIGGISFYNDPSMSFMTELFNKDMVKACSIPFEDNAYSKYLEAMVDCNLTLSGYSKTFMNKLKNLGDMVYPLVSKSTYGGKASMPNNNMSKKGFSSNTNKTLKQMKKKY